MTFFRTHAAVLAVLVFAFLAMLLTDRSFAILDDETEIVTLAAHPVHETLNTAFATGQHEHPPLSDILLHYWLPIAGMQPALLRLPSIALYFAGVLVLALAARRLAGERGFAVMILIACLWPFGFHFARMTGWYSFCFFLVALLTWGYLRYLDRPSAAPLALCIAAALALLYSNYYGVVIVGCIVLDSWTRGKAARPLWFTLWFTIVCALSWIPLALVFFDKVGDVEVGGGFPLLSDLANAGYNFYTLFVSEAVAPWVWWLGIPAGLAIGAAVIALCFALRKQDRRFLIYFAILFGGMVIAGIVNQKRMLFITPWLLLAIAVAVAAPRAQMPRKILVVALIFVAGTGWFGIITRKYYSASHFIEPWPQLAEEGAQVVRDGGAVVTNGLSLLFELNYAMHRYGLIDAVLPARVVHPRVFESTDWREGIPQYHHTVLFVDAVNNDEMDDTAAASAWLLAHCTPQSSRMLVPDSGFDFKQRLFPDMGQKRFRITAARYVCP